MLSLARSGSCPSQLLQVVQSPERSDREVEARAQEKGRHSMGGSQRLRSNKHRPNILPAAGNMSVFSRSVTSTTPTASANQEPMAAASVAASAAVGAPREKDKPRVRNLASPGVTERYVCAPVIHDKLVQAVRMFHYALLRFRFRCITPYPPNSEYELELRVGDVVYVHKKRDDGWYKGTLHRTGKTGLFPASFVESC